jgi:hypothetical protein
MSFEAIVAVAQHLYQTWTNKLRTAKNQQEAATIQRDRLHSFRMELEPYIYHYLIEQYGLRLNAVWENYVPPLKSDRAYVLVERRCHPNYPFLLKMMAWAAPHLSVYLVCSDANLEFIKQILGDKLEHFHILVTFSGEVDREQGRTEYNQLLTNATFFEEIDAEYMVTVQMDVILRKKLPDSLFCGDYWGAPWGWCSHRPGCGGSTVRRVKKMIEVCRQYSPDLQVVCKEGEDCWMSDRIEEIGTFPPLAFRRAHIMESMPTDDPVIVHQFWTYLDSYHIHDRERFREILKQILTMAC